MAFLLSSSSYYFPMFYLKNGFEYSKKTIIICVFPKKMLPLHRGCGEMNLSFSMRK